MMMMKGGSRRRNRSIWILALLLCGVLTGILAPAIAEGGSEGGASAGQFAYSQARYIGTLDGQTFVIVKENYSGGMLALSSTAAQNGGGQRLAATYVNVLEEGTLTSVTALGGSTASDAPITAWTFEHWRDNLYYIRSDDGKYLCIDGDNLTAGSDRMLIEVFPITKKVKIEGDNKNEWIQFTGNIYLRAPKNGTNYHVNLKKENNRLNFKGSTYSDANSTLSLYIAAEPVAYDVVYARKISSLDIVDGQELVIYRRVYNEATGKYEIYVVDGNGKLVYAYDEGDVVAYRAEDSAIWKATVHTSASTDQPSGYYDFLNEATGNYLAPQCGSILSDGRLGVVLHGREQGKSNSTIEGWDSSEWVYCGYRLDLDDRVLLPGVGADSQEFSFATPVELPQNTLHEVATVDSASKGITIQMFDFPNRTMMNLFSDNEFYSGGAFKQGLLERRLGSDGLPVTTTGNSLSQIYKGTYSTGNANHLFLKSVYDATGYYEYNSFKNFAHYDPSTGDFTVYDEQATPNVGIGGSDSSYYRGNYMPYNNIDPTNVSPTSKLYDTGWDWTTLEDPAFQGTLYRTLEDPDYYFGTIVDANFFQAVNGRDERDNPIVYSFSGDDDLWVYLDGVLVLDIGGIHSAVDGTIDFSTGAVRAGDTATTIKACFQAAGVFPDGKPWDDDKVDHYFKGDTFIDYSAHNMKMFYQERGAGASTLRVSFNLPVVEPGTFAVEKQLLGTNQQAYANVEFAYQAFLRLENGEKTPLYPGVILDGNGNIIPEAEATEAQKENRVEVVYEDTEEALTFADEVEIGGEPYEHVFYLKSGQAAVFSGIPEGVKYYVQEINVSGEYYETVMINQTDLFDEGGIPENEYITAVSTERTILERQRVVFGNQCSSKNMRDLRITKEVLNGPVDDGATFEFRVMLESINGNMTYYSKGEYYLVRQVDGEEHYFKYAGGVLADQGTEPVVCSLSGQYGTIAGVPDGYTVVIKGLLAGTHFFVEEIRNPVGYLFVEKLLAEGTYDPAEMGGADGQIRLGVDAQETICNRLFSSVQVKKVWNSPGIAAHGDVTVALFCRTGGLAPAEDLQGCEAVQTIEWTGTTAVWNLSSGVDPEDYTVREVLVDGDTVAPIEEGGVWLLAEERGSSGAIVDSYYIASYAEGEAAPVGGSDIVARTDTITNTRLVSEADVVVTGIKIMTGRDMDAEEFEFVLEPLDEGSRYGLGGAERLTARNEAAEAGVESPFAFPALHYTLEDYLDAPNATADGGRAFYYVVTETQGESGGVTYSQDRFLVRVILRVADGALQAEGPTCYPYDGETIPPEAAVE